MDTVPGFLQYGAIGLMATTFLGLYLTERREHNQTRREKEALLEARRLDAKETMVSLTKPMLGIAQTLDLIETKLLDAKGVR